MEAIAEVTKKLKHVTQEHVLTIVVMLVSHVQAHGKTQELHGENGAEQVEDHVMHQEDIQEYVHHHGVAE